MPDRSATDIAAPEPLDSIDTSYQLRDNLTRTSGRVFLTGTQALVRMLVMQRLADRARGLNTAGFVSGYRGSPLAGVDMEMWRAKAELDAHQVRFLPGINEDLAATMMLGTQQAGMAAERKVDGVFAMWYGKGPGVDRAGDALHHGNAAGASRHGGVLLIVGDDHAATSSSIPNASDLSLMGWNIPIVHPASVEEYVEFGLWGWALSRCSSTWVAFKAISETVESGRAIPVAPPPLFDMPDDGTTMDALEFRTSDFLTLAIEQRLAQKMDAVAAFARVHSIDRLVVAAPHAEVGIITVGKAHVDVMEALRRLGHGPEQLEQAGIRIYKPGLVYPLEAGRLRDFAHGLRHILVVEEKASVVEAQVKDLLFNAPHRPEVVGKHDVDGTTLIDWVGQLRPATLAPLLAQWLARVRPGEIDAGDGTTAWCRFARPAPLPNAADAPRRMPYFCSGCPHNTSTRVPEGSRALAGVGCHYMASWMERNTGGLTQMGGEGMDWVGLAPYTDTRHVFQNMGEGTYFHSGHLAIRQAIAADVNVTYKILFNDAVAMTGGQPVDGQISVPRIVQQLRGEGARQIVVVSDEPEKYRHIDLGAGVAAHHRRELDRIQRELRDVAGVTILIYDQTCAAEKRRRRKRGDYPDPARRVVINSAVCEGCGDCGVQSNCLSIVPLETPFGRKRAIDQSSCNKDQSCVEGFCPSFVSVIGGRLRAAPRQAGWSDDELARRVAALPATPPPLADTPHNLMIAGVGGTGVITLGALVAMAAHLEGHAVSVLDFTALAQKGGSVISHIRLARRDADLNQVRIDWQEAQALIVCDMVVGVLPDVLGTIRHDVTSVLVNSHIAPTAEFTRNADADPDAAGLRARIEHAAGAARVTLIDADDAARALLGDVIGANMFLLGHAWQAGLIPVGLAALHRAIELNGVSVAANRKAFAHGRLAAAGPAAPRQVSQVIQMHLPESLDGLIERRRVALTAYQNAAYAQRYVDFVRQVETVERQRMPGLKRLTLSEAVARYLFKLMAFKDEYEVARLYTDGTFQRQIEAQFEGDWTLNFHMAPPLLARRKPGTDELRKMALGAGTLRLLRVLAALRGLRGSWLDVFGWTAERRAERRLIGQYRADIGALLASLTPERHALAVELASLPEGIRGYGHVKARHLVTVTARRAALLERLQAGPADIVEARRQA